jgi:hypothetical protein
MKRVLSLVLLLLSVSDVSAAEPSGDEILRRSRKAYAALRAYVGTTTVQSKTVVSAATLSQTANAKITFVRPGQIRIEGKDVQGQPFSIVSDGKQTWLAWAAQHNGQFRKADSLEKAVSAMTGVAALAPTTIPAALIPLEWGTPWTMNAEARSLGLETLAGVDCYKVVVKSPPGSALPGTRTFWLDPKSFLLRQLREEQDEQDMAQMQDRMEKMMAERAGKGSDAEKAHTEKIRGMLKAQLMKSRDIIQSFQIDRLNTAIDTKLFQDPSKGGSQQTR